MPITGKFAADFASFYEAVDKAQVSLTSFEQGGAKVASQMTRVANALQGNKLIQDAAIMAEAIDRVGGVSTLTEAQLAKVGAQAAEAANKLRALGQDVPPGIQKIADAAKDAGDKTSFLGQAVNGVVAAASVGALARFAADIVSIATNLENMSARTGIGVDALQRLNVVAEQNGANLEEVGKAIFQMGKRIAGDNASAESAVRQLGLSFEDLKAMKPEAAFNVIGTAIGQLPDPFKQSELGAALFGRSVQDLIPVFKHLADDTGTYIPLTGAQVGLLHDLDSAYVRVKASIVPATVAWIDNNLGLSRSIELTQLLRGEIGSMPGVIDPWTAAMKKRVAPDITDGLTHEKEIIAQLDAEMKLNRDETDELNSAGNGWKGTVEGINGTVAESVKYYLQAGVAQKTLADQFGLTATQVKALASELRDESEEEKKANEGAAEATRLWDDYATKIDKGGTSIERQQAQVDKYFQDLAAKMQAAGTDTAEFYAAWAADWDATSAKIQSGEDALLAKYEAAEAAHISMATDGVTRFGQTVSAVTSGIVTAASSAAAALAAVWGSMSSDPQRAYSKDSQDISTAKDKANGVSRYDLGPGAQVQLQDLVVTSANRSSLIAQLQSIEAEYARFPGRMAGGNGLTGLNSNDADGWTAMLNEQALFAQLKKALPGYKDGGPVLQDGPIYAHAGEFVIPNNGGASSGGSTTVNLMLDGRVLTSVVIDRMTGRVKQDRLWPAR